MANLEKFYCYIRFVHSSLVQKAAASRLLVIACYGAVIVPRLLMEFMANKVDIGGKKVQWLELETFKVISAPEEATVQNGVSFENPGYRLNMEEFKHPEDSEAKAEPSFRNKPVHLYENVFIPLPDYENTTSSKSHAYEEFSLEELPTAPEVDMRATAVTLDNNMADITKLDDILLKVSRFDFLDSYYLLVGLFLLVLGIIFHSTCKMNFFIILVIPFSVLAILTAIVNLGLKDHSQNKVSSWFSTSLCFGAFFKMVISILGIYNIYIHYPPEEYDSSNPKFCPSLLYWSAFYVFTLSTLIYAVICTFGVAVILGYCL